ncbi:hypothetical protein ABW19_dt0208022 [Dactylella cylindrospora]|nr:hypothetical protein ABW19_dt0208022 [Dactylella cylindrospora]
MRDSIRMIRKPVSRKPVELGSRVAVEAEKMLIRKKGILSTWAVDADISNFKKEMLPLTPPPSANKISSAPKKNQPIPTKSLKRSAPSDLNSYFPEQTPKRVRSETAILLRESPGSSSGFQERLKKHRRRAPSASPAATLDTIQNLLSLKQEPHGDTEACSSIIKYVTDAIKIWKALGPEHDRIVASQVVRGIFDPGLKQEIEGQFQGESYTFKPVCEALLFLALGR